MKRSVLVLVVLAVSMVATALQATAAGKPHIEDPLNDANFINDQGTGDGAGQVTPADGGSVSDILGVTFSNDKKNLYIDISTEAAPPAITGIGYRVRTNPDDGGTHCLVFEAFHPGANNVLTAARGSFTDTCEGGDPVEIEVLGTRLVIPRKAHPAFGKGGKLTAPQAQSFLYSGEYGAGVAGPYPDTTQVGTDFAFKK